jgi:hypothetical protein
MFHHEAINAFQRQHQPQRHADFQQVFLAFGCLCDLGRDMPPGRLEKPVLGTGATVMLAVLLRALLAGIAAGHR